MRTILILYGQIFVWGLLIVFSPLVVIVQIAINISIHLYEDMKMMSVLFYYKPKWAMKEISDTLAVIKLKKRAIKLNKESK